MAHPDADALLAWKRFGEVVREARVRRGWLNQDELARAAGVSKRAVGQVERGAGGKRLRPTRVAMDIATALGWLPGSVDRVLHGEDPIVLPGKPTDG